MLETNSLHHTKVQIVPFTGNKKLSLLIQQSPTFLSPGTGFMEDSFSVDPGGWGCFGDDLRALHVLCTLFLLLLHQLHLKSSGIRSQRLGTPALIPSLDQYSGLFYPIQGKVRQELQEIWWSLCVCSVASVVSSSLGFSSSPPGSSVHGILQARILEWVAISFSKGSFNPGIELASFTSPAFTTSTT